jgi:hypothetical protein
MTHLKARCDFIVRSVRQVSECSTTELNVDAIAAIPCDTSVSEPNI